MTLLDQHDGADLAEAAAAAAPVDDAWARRSKSRSLPLAIRWSAAISALVILVMVLLGWFLIGQQQKSYRHQTDMLGRMIVEQFARSASEPLMADDLLSLQVLASQQKKNELVIGMQILDLDGRQLIGEGEAPVASEVPSGTAGPALGKQAIHYRQPVTFQGTRVGYAQVSIDLRPLERNQQSLITALIATTIGLIALGVVLAVPLAHRLARPIHRLVEVGEAIDRGEPYTLPGDRRKDEIGRVLYSFSRMAAGLDQKRHAEQALSRYLSPNVAQRVLADDGDSVLGGIRAEGSVLFCDVVGFTELSEAMSPEQVADLLNDYFSYFALASSSCLGTVDKFIGDCIMILFGIPEHDPHHALHATTCAVLIQAIVERINRRRHHDGLATVQFRIGINSGPMLAGNLGSQERMQYTVVGDVVNLASRICALAEPGGILLTGSTAQQPDIEQLVQPAERGQVQVRGRQTPVATYVVDPLGVVDPTLIQSSLEAIMPGGAVQ